MSKHLKRLAAPRSWTIPRKTNVYTAKPRPGAHAIEGALPLGVILRDHLGLVATGREAARVIGAGEVQVDGRVVKDAKFAVGFMDSVSVPKVGKAWRVTLDEKARLRLAAIAPDQAAWKLARIQDKTTVSGGRTQLNLHDGRNLLVKKDDYKTGDVLRIEVPSQKVLGHFPLTEGAQVFVTGGQHAGAVAPVKAIEVKRSIAANLVHLSAGEATFTTVKPYAFPIGDRANLPSGAGESSGSALRAPKAAKAKPAAEASAPSTPAPAPGGEAKPKARKPKAEVKANA